MVTTTTILISNIGQLNYVERVKELIQMTIEKLLVICILICINLALRELNTWSSAKGKGITANIICIPQARKAASS